MAATTTNHRQGDLSYDTLLKQAAQQLESVETRTTTVACQEFFAGTLQEWRSDVAQRTLRLCHVLTTWVRNT